MPRWLKVWIVVSALPFLVGAYLPGSIVSSPLTYYVCAKANGGTCVYNGDAGTVAATISDSNDCLKKSTPCATMNGVATKLSGKIISAIVTIQLADTAGTGTDCYRPNGTVFQMMNLSLEIESSLAVGEARPTSIGAYPQSYVYLVGNTTTPSNVIMTGATTCAGTTGTDVTGVLFTNVVVRVRGIQAQYFANYTSGPDNGAFTFYKSVVHAEDLYCVGDTTKSTTLLVAYEHSVIRLGSSLQWSITACNPLNILNESHGSFQSPLGNANIAIVASTGWTPSGGLITSNEKSHMGVDGLSLNVSGAGTVTVWFAIDHSSIYWNDAETFTGATKTISINGANITNLNAADNSYIKDACRTVGNLVCNIGNTTPILRMARIDRSGYIVYLSTPAGVANTDNIVGGTTSPTGWIDTPTTSISETTHSQLLVSTSTLTKTTDTTLATVPGLSQNLIAGKTYSCSGHLNGASGATGGIKVSIVASNGLTATSSRFTGFTWNGITAVAQTTSTALPAPIVANAAIYSDVYITGAIVVNAAGTINVQAAQQTSNATSTTVLLLSTFGCVRTN